MEPANQNNQNLPEGMMIHLLYILHQFLRESNYMKEFHELEREYALYFDITYFKELVGKGAWDELEHYLGGFTTIQKNDVSKKMFFEIRKQKYLEALERDESELANAILQSDFSAILGAQDPLFRELSSLQLVDNFRTNRHLSAWKDIPTSRNNLVVELPKLVPANPDLNHKLSLPQLNGRLVALARKSLNAEFSKCDCLRDLLSLLREHRCCHQQNGPSQPSPQQQAAPAHVPVQSDATAPRRALAEGAHRRATAKKRPEKVSRSKPRQEARAEPVTPPENNPQHASTARLPTGTSASRPPPQNSELASAAPVSVRSDVATCRRAPAKTALKCVTAKKTPARALDSRLHRKARTEIVTRSTTAARKPSRTFASRPPPDVSAPSVPLELETTETPQRPAEVKKSARILVSTSTSRPPPKTITGVASQPSLHLVPASFSASLNGAVSTPFPPAEPLTAPETSVAVPTSSSKRASSARDGGQLHKKKARIENNSVQEHQLSQPLPNQEPEPSAPALDQFYEIKDPLQVKTLTPPSVPDVEKVHKLKFNEPGTSLIALTGSGEHLIWQWEFPASVGTMPALVRPVDGIRLINDKPEAKDRLFKPSHSFDLTNNWMFIFSTSGGNVNLYSLEDFKKISCDIQKSVTGLATHPHDDHLLVIGTDDSQIEIHDIDRCKVERLDFFEGHQGRVTDLMLDQSGNLLVSGGAFGQVFVWELNKSKKPRSTHLPIPTGLPIDNQDTHIRLHKDGDKILVAHESLLAIFDISTLDCLAKWILPETFAALCDATYSSDCKQIFSGAEDGSVLIFDASTLQPRSRIAPQAYQTSSATTRLIYPNALAAHPKNRDQVALGMSDGQVILLELVDRDLVSAETILELGAAARVSADARHDQTEKPAANKTT